MAQKIRIPQIGEVRISFMHFHPQIKVGGKTTSDGGHLVELDPPIRAVTVCRILIGEPPALTVIAQGESFCSVLDVFDKKKARDITFGRALKNLPEVVLTKLQRRTAVRELHAVIRSGGATPA